MESAKEGLKKKTEGKLPAVIAAPPKSAAEMRRSLLEYVEGKIVGAADREGFQYQTMQHTLKRYDASVRAKKQLSAEASGGLRTAETIQQYVPNVRLASILDKADENRHRQNLARRRRNSAQSELARQRILRTSLTRHVVARRDLALNVWLRETLTHNKGALLRRWLTLARLSQSSSFLVNAMLVKRRAIKARNKLQAMATLTTAALRSAKRAKQRIATDQIFKFLIDCRENRSVLMFKGTSKKTRKSVRQMQARFRAKLLCREAQLVLLSRQFSRAVEHALSLQKAEALHDGDTEMAAVLSSLSAAEVDGTEDLRKWLHQRTKEHSVLYQQWEQFAILPKLRQVLIVDGEARSGEAESDLRATSSEEHNGAVLNSAKARGKLKELFVARGGNLNAIPPAPRRPLIIAERQIAELAHTAVVKRIAEQKHRDEN
jgi:hypothetical protein